MKAGDEQMCPRCNEWHVLEQRNTDKSRPPHERAELYVTCGGSVYVAGLVGGVSRTPFRRRT